VILEFATPRFAPLRALYLFYFRHILPAVGRIVSKHRDAYTYLPESVLAFPEPAALARRFTAAGFHDVEFELLTGGICAVHHGTR
jgi:demethylmenaquinone methyltransferase/2-methoxy-6-polyprenyl-1,4-benzoquinol methylase